MKFDVIVGNPPYQLNDNGFGRSAVPIYNKFVQQAKKLMPRYLTMIIPSRWFAGGKGLGKFRKDMLNDDRIRKIVDFEDANEVFPGVDIAGGVCYFLWERDSRGLCEVVNVHAGSKTSSTRSLNEFDILLRNGHAVPIVRKILAKGERRMNDQVSVRKPFGLKTYERPQKTGDIKLFWRKGVGPYSRKDITTGVEMIDKWKVVTCYAGNDHAGNPGKDGKKRVLSRIEILPPGTVCTESYLVVGSFSTEAEAQNLVGYMQTKFFRFLLSQFMCSQQIAKKCYAFIPILNMSMRWTDQMLYERYGLTQAEIAFIESKIRPMRQ